MSTKNAYRKAKAARAQRIHDRIRANVAALGTTGDHEAFRAAQAAAWAPTYTDRTLGMLVSALLRSDRTEFAAWQAGRLDFRGLRRIERLA